MPTKCRVVVYIASPYTQGDVEANVRRSIDCADNLLRKGYIPISPLLSHYWEKRHPHSYHTWIEYDNNIISVLAAAAQADRWTEFVMLRLPGESPGADREVELAGMLGVPVAVGVDELYKRFPIAAEAA